MLVTELGMVTDVSLEQPSKALCPMLVTELGMVTDVSPVQPLKAHSPMCFVPSFIFIFVFSGIVPLYL